MQSSAEHVRTSPARNDAPDIEEKVDIEHALVEDDPRQWSTTRKASILIVVSAAAVIGGLGANLYNPAIAQIQQDLNATSGEISWSISLYLWIQGSFPVFWSAFSEIYGRKKIYLVSFALGIVGFAVAATARTIGILIGMRCLQAAGTSAVFAIGAATLADIFDPHVRGTMMGIYYGAPLLGPALGPILGGVLSQAWNWRATFWFMVVFTGLCLIAFIPFPDTFRRERSLTYQSVLRRRLREQAKKDAANPSLSSSTTQITNTACQAKAGGDKVTSDSNPLTVEMEAVRSDSEAKDLEKSEDVEGQKVVSRSEDISHEIKELRLTLKDVNPIRPFASILSRPNNVAILCTSGLIAAIGYCMTYTCARTLSSKYNYNALQIGLVLLSFGLGSVSGSVIGGRLSDRTFTRLKEENGGVGYPEMRLASTKYAMLFLPPVTAAYGWCAEKNVHVAAICIFVFFTGFLSIAMYASTLAYVVDANTGRSSSAVAANGVFRGTSAFIATEVAVPLQLAIGDGGLYTLWAGLMIVTELLIVLVWWKGREWRERCERKEALLNR
ncbi:MFS general substrate transporter [Panus rudis PR-1116 ss-1]|nr:MFS general substrate transporter [Panus rudis PR-1116 ss-1]